MTDHAPLEEPKTPMWLPALGVALFLLAGVWWATRPAPVIAQPTTTAAALDAGAPAPAPSAAQ